MKIKPGPKRGRVLVELSRKDPQLLAAVGSSERPSPFRLQKILVPIDFSDCSRKALQYAIPFARHFNASLVLLHVLELNYDLNEFGAVDFPVLEADLRGTAEQQMQALLGLDELKDIPVQAAYRSGRPFQEITGAARELEADLIILSTHGHTGLRHMILGSTAENVVRYAPCPVLTVRQQEHEFVTELPPAPKGPGHGG
jgi:nucleotide-binding universal stress UspA family protein